jgi:endonuclease IV
MYKYDPDNITPEAMRALAKHIEDYLELYEEVLIIPEEIIYKKNQIDEAIKTVKKLIKKLRNGDSGVFKDADEWNSVL